MAANAYPHIVFAKNAEVLPQQTLADLLVGLFPDATVDQGEIKAELRLADSWTATFWYDDEADGLGDRYADFAAPLRRKRVTRCTTMIDASGAEDPDGTHARDMARIMAALAEREGVYVFSEETKRFVGMDYDDQPGVVAVDEPAADLTSDASYAPHAADGEREVALQGEETSGDFAHTEEHAVDRPTDAVREATGREEERPVAAEPVTTQPVTAGPDAVEPRVTEPVLPATAPSEPPVPGPAVDPVTPSPAPRPAPTTQPAPAAPATDSPAAAGTPVEPAHTETEPAREEKKGFFKKLFGRKG